MKGLSSVKAFAVLVLVSPILCQAKALPRLFAYDIGPDSGTLVFPMAINEKGRIAGYIFSNGAFSAFITGARGQQLATIVGLGDNSFGYSINESGQVSGASTLNGQYSPFITRADGQDARVLVLPVVDSVLAAAQSVNDAGVSTGDYKYVESGKLKTSSFIASHDDVAVRPIEIFGGDQTAAAAINNAGQIAGTSTRPGDTVAHVFVLDSFTSSIVDLGNPTGGDITVRGFSADGRPVGEVSTGTDATQPFSFSADRQAIVVRPTLGGTRGAAYAVSRSGQIAGSSTPTANKQNEKAFIAGATGRLYDLNQFVVNRPPGITLTKITAVNSRGQMTAFGDDGHGYILCATVNCR